MPLPDSQARQWPAPLRHRLTADANAVQVAQAVATIWAEADQALYPIVGRRGVEALLHRSLRLATASHPWLAQSLGPVVAASGQPSRPGDALVAIGAIQAVLAKQPIDQAGAGAMAFLQSFHGLLTSLVGASLTDRLLRAVWNPPSAATPAQGTSP